MYKLLSNINLGLKRSAASTLCIRQPDGISEGLRTRSKYRVHNLNFTKDWACVCTVIPIIN